MPKDEKIKSKISRHDIAPGVGSLTPEMDAIAEKDSVLRKIKQDKASRSDTWFNPVSGIGGFDMNADRTQSNMIYWTRLPFVECESVFSGDDIARKIVIKVVHSACRQGFKVKTPEFNTTAELKFNQEIKEEFIKKHLLGNKVPRAAIWGRLYGSAYLLLNIEDGRHPSEPVDYDNVKSIKWIKEFTPFELYVLEKDYKVSGNYLEPEFYTFVSYGADVVEKVHHTRVIRFIGKELPRYLYISNNYVHDSVINNIYMQLGDYAVAVQGAGYAVSEFSQGVFKLKGLSQLFLSGKQDKVIERMYAMDKGRSMTRSIVIDSEDSFDRLSGQFSGITEPISQLKNDLAARCEIPHNILFNEGAGTEGALVSSGGDGESEKGIWQSEVSEYQRLRLKEPLEKLFKVLFANQENGITGGDIPDLKLLSPVPLRSL